jgi:hypothetical protein
MGREVEEKYEKRVEREIDGKRRVRCARRGRGG